MAASYKFYWKQLKGNSQEDSALTDWTQELKFAASSSHELSNTHGASGCLFCSASESMTIDMTANKFNPVVLAKVELPNGVSYKFTYTFYGEIEQIYSPTGSREKFEYAAIPNLGDMPDELEVSPSYQFNRRVKKREVFEDAAATTATATWLYDAQRIEPRGYKVSITAPDNSVSEMFLHRGKMADPDAQIGDYGYDNGLSGMVYEERAFSGGSPRKLFARKLTRWEITEFAVVGADAATKTTWLPRKAHEESFIYDTLGNALSSTVKFDYDGDLSQITTPLNLKRTTGYGFVVAASGSGMTTGEPPPANPAQVPNPTLPPTASTINGKPRSSIIVCKSQNLVSVSRLQMRSFGRIVMNTANSTQTATRILLKIPEISVNKF